MWKWILAAVAVAVLAIGGIVAMRMMAPPPDDLDLSRSRMTDGGLYSVAIEPEEEPLRQGTLHSWIVTVTSPEGGAVEDAEIAVDGGMPQHGHGLPTSPQATGHLGEGRYRIEGMRFNMGGWWVLDLVVTSPVGEDRITFNIVI